MSAELVLPNGQVRDLGSPANELDVPTEDERLALEGLVRSGGNPYILITFEDGMARLTAVGVDPDLVPAGLIALGQHMQELAAA